MKRLPFLFYLLLLIVSQTGCVMFEAAEVSEAGAVASEGGMLAEGISGLTRLQVDELATEGILADDIALFRSSAGEIRAGRLLSSEEAAFENEFGKIKIIRTPGENPKLYMNGYTKPFGEVYPEQGRINIYAVNRSFSIRRNIFSVEGESVNVLRDRSGNPSDVVATVYKGDLVIKLAEEDGWYRVKVLKDESNVTGFISTELLAPLITAVILADSTQSNSPYGAIRLEEKGRWDHYWQTMRSTQMTGKDALDLLYDEFSDSTFNRQVSYTQDDWQTSVTRFVKMDYENIPILSNKDFKDRDLQIIGFTKAGEMLEYVNGVTEMVKLNNPLDWGPKNYGTWYQVRTLDNQYGWILARPEEGQGYFSASIVERSAPVYQLPVEHQPVQQQEEPDEKKNEFPVKTILIIAGIVLFLAIIFKSNNN